jgi:hypothetical protein
VDAPDEFAQRAAALKATPAVAPTVEPPPRPLADRAEDVLTAGVSGVGFGFAEKGKAALYSALGQGNYDDLVAKYRKQVADAKERLGPTGAIASEVGGGVLTGSLAARAGLTLLGRVPTAAPLTAKIAAGAAEGAGYGAVHGAGHTDKGDLPTYLQNMATGAGGGAVVGGVTTGALSAAQRALTPFPAVNPQGHNPLVRTLDDAGVAISAGQRTNNPQLRLVEDVAAKWPLGNFFGGTRTHRQMEQVTREAMRESGIPAPPGSVATHGAVDEAFDRVGGGIGAIQGRHPVTIDNQALTDAVTATQQLPLLHETGKRSVIQHFIDRLTSGQTLSPEEASTIRTQLGRQIRNLNGKDADKIYQGQLQDVQRILDTALERSMANAGDHAGIAELANLRRQYTNLNILADAKGSSGAKGEQGILTPSALSAASSRSIGKINDARGRGNLHDLGSASEGVLQAPKDSNTTTRADLLNIHKLLMSPLNLIVNRRPGQTYLGNQAFPVPMASGTRAAGVAGAVAGADVSNPDSAVASEVVKPGYRRFRRLMDE